MTYAREYRWGVVNEDGTRGQGHYTNELLFACQRAQELSNLYPNERVAVEFFRPESQRAILTAFVNGEEVD